MPADDRDRPRHGGAGQGPARRRRKRGHRARSASIPSASRAPRRTAAPIARCSSRRRGFPHYVSGVILFDETLRQSTKDGVNFAKYLEKNGIIPGIKVDAGAHDMALHPGEKVTEGLDKLAERMRRVLQDGRALREVARRDHDRRGHSRRAPASTRTPMRSRATRRSARKRRSSPSSSPRCCWTATTAPSGAKRCTRTRSRRSSTRCAAQACSLEHVILKASMVVSGQGQSEAGRREGSGGAHVRVLKRTVPAALPGVVFLSGGQSDENATAHLDAMNRMGGLPWPLTFSYSRALQSVALNTWRGQAANVAAAQARARPSRPHEQPRGAGPVERRGREEGRLSAVSSPAVPACRNCGAPADGKFCPECGQDDGAAPADRARVPAASCSGTTSRSKARSGRRCKKLVVPGRAHARILRRSQAPLRPRRFACTSRRASSSSSWPRSSCPAGLIQLKSSIPPARPWALDAFSECVRASRSLRGAEAAPPRITSGP